jgi:GxxExxY protein
MNKMIRMQGEPRTYDLCGEIIGAAMKVHSALGPGFLESVYQNGLIWELRKAGVKAEPERPISVRYDGQIVGAFTADLLVNNFVIVEVKAIQTLAKPHEIQLVNYLTATGLNEGLPLNFGSDRLEFKKKFRLAKTDSAASKSTVIL